MEDIFKIPDHFVGESVEISFVDAIMTPQGPTYMATKGTLLEQTPKTITVRTANAEMVMSKARLHIVALPSSVQLSKSKLVLS